MNKFTTFWWVFVVLEYRRLGTGVVNVIKGIFCRRDSDGLNPMLVYDDGVLWRLGRDFLIVLASALRFLLGTLIIVTVVILLPIATVARIVVIPFLGVWRGIRLLIALRRLGNDG